MSRATAASVARFEMFGKSPLGFYLRLSERIWKRIPLGLVDLRPIRSYGHFLHSLVRVGAPRQMSLGTFFLRNRPELELMRRLSTLRGPEGTLKIAVLGASNGAEVYSIAWAIRSAQPRLRLVTHAIDI